MHLQFCCIVHYAMTIKALNLELNLEYTVQAHKQT